MTRRHVGGNHFADARNNGHVRALKSGRVGCRPVSMPGAITTKEQVDLSWMVLLPTGGPYAARDWKEQDTVPVVEAIMSTMFGKRRGKE